MDNKTDYHSIASILTSLGPEGRGGDGIGLVYHVAELFEHEHDGREKAFLAELLAALLSKSKDKGPGIALSQLILHNFVFDFVYEASDMDEKTHKNHQLGARIVLSLPTLLEDLFVGSKQRIQLLLLAALKSHVSSDDAFAFNTKPFIEKYCSFTLDPKGDQGFDSDFRSLYSTVISSLSFWEVALLTETNPIQPSGTLVKNMKTLPPFLISLMSLRNYKVAEISYQVLRLLLRKLDSVLPEGTSEMIWNGIQSLLKASTHADLAFGVWLRWVSLGGVKSRPSESMLGQENYWSLLQNGLSTGFSERRKFCLYILNSSLRLAPVPINNTLLKYNPSSLKDSAAWAKYSTMIEIISLSTSTNQFLAAVPDIRRLLEPSSPIYGSWVVVLMTLGLTSSCGPLQKAVWEFLLGLNGTELGKLLEKEKNFINDVFLPYSVAAHHFSTQKGNESRCEYGNKLAGFLQKIIVQSREVMGLLKFVDARQDTIFAPARVYVLKGIVDGAAAFSGVHGFGKEEMEIIVKISKMKRFALMKTDLCIFMCLTLLLSINLETTGLEAFLDAVAEIFAGKEHLITSNVVKSLRGFLVANNTPPQLISQELASMFRACNTEDIQPPRTLLRAVILALLGSGAGERSRTTFDLLFTNRNPKTNFQLLSLLFRSKGLASEILQEPNAHDKLSKAMEDLLTDASTNGHITELASLLHHQRAHHILDLLKTNTVMALFIKSWNLARKQAGDTKFNLEAGKLKGELLAICDACASTLVDRNISGDVTRILTRKTEVLDLIRVVPLPGFNQNKHENTAKLKTIRKFLYYAYGLLDSSIHQVLGLSDEFIKTLFDTTRGMLRYIDKSSLLRVLESFKTVFRSASTAVESYNELDSLVHELWECADLTSSVAEEPLLEVSLIKTIFDVSIIRASVEVNKALAKTLLEIGREIMKLSKGKRSLAPALAKMLWEGYLNTPEIFCSCKWMADIFIEFIDYIPSKDPEFFVETSIARVFDEICVGSNHYERYYEEKEEMAQVYIFDVLSRLDPSSTSESTFADCLRGKIYGPWALNKPGMPIYSKWKKTSQLQALLVLERFVTVEKSASFLATIIPTLCHEPHPRYRFIFEWMTALCITRYPENRDCLWGYLQTPEKPNPKLQASLLRVAIMVARELGEDLKEEFYTELLYTVIPLGNNNKVAVRHQATSMVLELWDDLAPWQHLKDNVVFQRLRQSILNSDFFKQIVAAGKMEQERTFNARSNYTLAGIFSGTYLLGGDEIDLIPLDLFTSLEAQNSRKKSFIPMGSVSQLIDSGTKVEYTKTEAAPIEAPLQTKRGTWDAKALAETREHRRNKAAPPKDNGLDIIIIASLIENAYNLGGLSRVSEIMGVSTLCFNTRDVLNLKDFTSVSVSSEVWLPIVELKATEIPDYIYGKKLEGYSAVGIEQTDRSVILGKEGYKLPKKVVLLLGSEKFGIPAELLAELDLCVEIPQKGETRSMNVQTAAAVVLYEFCRQFG